MAVPPDAPEDRGKLRRNELRKGFMVHFAGGTISDVPLLRPLNTVPGGSIPTLWCNAKRSRGDESSSTDPKPHNR